MARETDLKFKETKARKLDPSNTEAAAGLKRIE